MSEKFPDADEDDDILMTRMFVGEQAADRTEFEKFAEPFAQIENEKDAPPESSADEPNETAISAAENERESEKPVEPLPPEIRKANEDKFWEGKIERLKNENHDQPDDLPAENSQPDDSQIFVEPANEPTNFTLPFRDAPVNPESPAENETVDFQPLAADSGAVNPEKTKDDYPIFASSRYQSETSDETIRKSGLAYAAAIVLFGSIVFTLVLGWFADLLLGTSPWGKVGGIILGAIIGFIQFFRTTSQILKNKD